MLLSYNRLCQLVDDGVIQNVNPENINGSSIDIVMGNKILIEKFPECRCPVCGARGLTTDPVKSFKEQRWHSKMTCFDTDCGYSGTLIDFVEPVDFAKKQPLSMQEIDITEGYIMYPGESVLAHSVEVFNLPHHITAEYRLKSSMARVFLEHLHAGWCDPGWHGSVLTLEFSNMSRFHPLILRAGEKCGQVMFYEHEEVPAERSYTYRGQYNGDTSVSGSKGVK